MSVFGNTGNSGQTGGSLFGNTNSGTTGATGTTGGGLFGGAGNTGSLFGGGTNTTGGTGAAPSLFGTTNTTSTPGGGLFGGGTQNASAAPTGGLFGRISGTAAPAAPSAPTSNIFGSAPAPTTGGTGLFGNTTTTTNANANANTNTATTAPTSVFGAGSPFAKQEPAAGANAAANSAPKSLFGGLSTTPSTSAPAAPAANNLFKPPAAPTSTATTTTPSLFGAKPTDSAAPTPSGGLFGLPPKPAAGTTPAAPSTTPAAPAAGGLFGAKPAGTTPAATTTAAPAAGGSLFGGGLFGGAGNNAAKAPEKQDAAAPAAPTNTTSLFGTKPAENKDTPSANAGALVPKPAGATTSGSVAIPPPSTLRGKSVEEIVNRWVADLEPNVKEFNKLAGEVAVWDSALIENGNNISALFNHVLAAERQEAEINETLEHIEQQQKDLASTIEAYEKVTQEILGGMGGSFKSLDTGPADSERDKNYMLATDLHTHLDDLSESLKQMINSVNELSIASKPTDSADEPMTQIAQILSSHLESLQWIDSTVRDVEGKTVEIEKRVKESGYSLGGTGSGKTRLFGSTR